MAKPTYATLATFRVDLTREAEQRIGLERIIIPGVRQHPGFIAGTWTLDRETSESFVLLTYATRDAAEVMRENIVHNAEHQRAVGIELVSVRMLEISASAAAGDD